MGLYGVNYNKAYVLKTAKYAPGEYNGQIRTLLDTHVFVADVNAIAQTIKIGKLPAGARVLASGVMSDSVGTTGKVNLGYVANGVDAADADAFNAASDISGQRALVSGAGEGIGKKFTVETEVEAAFTEASDAALGKTFCAWVCYILD